MKNLYARLLAWLLAPVLKPLEGRVQALQFADAERRAERVAVSARIDAVAAQANCLSDALADQARTIG